MLKIMLAKSAGLYFYSVKIKPIALAAIELHLSEGISHSGSHYKKIKFCSWSAEYVQLYLMKKFTTPMTILGL